MGLYIYSQTISGYGNIFKEQISVKYVTNPILLGMEILDDDLCGYFNVHFFPLSPYMHRDFFF